MQTLTLLYKSSDVVVESTVTYFDGKTYKERIKQAEFYVYTSLGLNRSKYKISLKQIK